MFFKKILTFWLFFIVFLKIKKENTDLRVIIILGRLILTLN